MKKETEIEEYQESLLLRWKTLINICVYNVCRNDKQIIDLMYVLQTLIIAITVTDKAIVFSCDPLHEQNIIQIHCEYCFMRKNIQYYGKFFFFHIISSFRIDVEGESIMFKHYMFFQHCIGLHTGVFSFIFNPKIKNIQIKWQILVLS